MNRSRHVSADTTYHLELKQVIPDLFLVKLHYEYKGKKQRRPILYYRISRGDVAEQYFNNIDKIIEMNGESLCLSNLTKWNWSIHPIKYLFTNRN